MVKRYVKNVSMEAKLFNDKRAKLILKLPLHNMQVNEIMWRVDY